MDALLSQRTPAPRTPSDRYASLDVLRGIAILGTFATNVWIFTNLYGLPGYITGAGRDELDAVSLLAEAFLQQLSQGKFLGLLTIMFGIGLELQRRSARRHGRRWPGRYPWRAALLFVDGILHFFLIAEFDVLMGYAVTGVVVAYLLATSERAQRWTMAAACAVHLLLLTSITLAMLAAGPAVPLRLDPNPYASGTWWDLVQFRFENLVLFRIESVFILPLCIALFLLGTRLARAGVLGPAGRGLRRRLLILGCVALPVDAILPFVLGPAGVVLSRYGTAPLIALAILALVVNVLERRPRPGFLRRQVAAVGQMALSCYVLQNLLASVLCYGWGFGLTARTPEADRVGLTIVVYLVVVVLIVCFARVWERWFGRGPLERLLSRGYRALAGHA